MSLSLRCPFCKTRLKVPDKLEGTKVRCPKCESHILGTAGVQEPPTPPPAPVREPKRSRSMQTTPEPVTHPVGQGVSTFVPDDDSDQGNGPLRGEVSICPNCEAISAPGTKVCPHCDHDFLSKKKRKGKKKKFSIDMDQSGLAKKKLPPANWHSIYQIPVDIENVATEAILMSVWIVIYYCMFLSVLTPLVHPVFGFALLLAFVRYMRILNVQKDISLRLIVLGMFMFLIVWFFGSQLYCMYRQIPSQSILGFAIHVRMFCAMTYLCLLMTMTSFYFGKHFAICNRSAYGAMVSGDDRGGFMDFCYAVVVSAVSFLPLMSGIVLARIGGVGMESSRQTLLISAGALLPLAGWALFYFPMAFTVAAIEFKVSPARVAHWIAVCFADYIKVLLLLFPFLAAVVVPSWYIAWGMTNLVADVTDYDYQIFAFNFFFVFNFFAQYAYVVSVTALGVIARMHETKLGWYKV